MKRPWLFSCCLFLALPSFSQERDTVLAVHKLFKQQRPKRSASAAGGAQLAQGSGSAAERLVMATAGGVTFAAVSFWQNRRYSVEREALILQQYAQGVPIPADIRRRLHGKLFKRTAQDVRDGF